MSHAFPTVRQHACIRYRFRYSDCRRCDDACPHAAVTLTDNGVSLDPARCQNCALCVSACRTGALVSDQLRPIDWLRAAAGHERAAYCCPQQSAAGATRVPCLGSLDAVMLAYLARRGVATDLWGSDRCADCPHGRTGAAQLALNIDAVGIIDAALRDDRPWAPITLRQSEGQRETVVASRRQLFRRLIGRGVDAMIADGSDTATLPVPEKAIRAGSYFVPEQRALLSIVLTAKTPAARDPATHAALPGTGLQLAAGCTHCEACFRACPTAALQIDESAEHWALRFAAEQCVACEVCVEVCQPGVLTATAEVPLAGQPPTELHRLRKQRCRHCERPFVSAEPRARCPICDDDDAAFADIFG